MSSNLENFRSWVAVVFAVVLVFWAITNMQDRENAARLKLDDEYSRQCKAAGGVPFIAPDSTPRRTCFLPGLV